MDDAVVGSERGHDAGFAVSRAVVGFVLLGIVIRLVRCLLNFPMWCDETMLAANLLDRPWHELARPLLYHQVCPFGFLGLEWAVVRLLGFSELSLRLVPVVCAVASVPAFAFLARRALGAGTDGTLLAVALFAVSEPLIRFSAEVKPYSADLLVGVALLSVAVVWLQAPGRVRGLWALAALTPLAVALSLPSVFLIAAVALVGLRVVLARRSTVVTIAYGGFVAAAGLAVAAMALLGQYQASPDDRAYFLNYWAGAFPPSWQQPGRLVAWLVRTHTGPLFAYPLNRGIGRDWLPALVFGSFVAGALVYGRRQRGVVALLVLPFLLALSAAALRRYPYGMSVRVGQFLAPATLLLAGGGAAWLTAKVRPSALARRLIPGLVVALGVLGLAESAQDLTHPYRTPWDRTAREFARWFWEELAADGELVCVRTDLNIPFRPGPWSYDGTDQYLCFQRIYSRRHRLGLPPSWGAVSDTRPLRCVLLNRLPGDVPAFRDGVVAHRDRYTLRAVRTYPATRGSDVEPALTYVVCEFVPAPQRVAARELPSGAKDKGQRSEGRISK